MKKSDYIGKSIKVLGAGVGLVVEGYEVGNSKSPITDVIKVMFPDGSIEILVDDIRRGSDENWQCIEKS